MARAGKGGQAAHGGEGDAEVGALAHKVGGTHVEVGQAHTHSADEKGGELVAHHREHHAKRLHAAEKARVAQDVAVGTGGFG